LIEFEWPNYPFLYGTIHIELSAQPSTAVKWVRTHPKCKLDPSQASIDRRRQRADILEKTKVAVDRVMESCMPKHPEYDRRLFTNEAWKKIKAEVWTCLGIFPGDLPN